MGIFDYRDLDRADAKALFSDAMAISTYAYHNIDNGFAAGYQSTGFGLGLPLTLVTALIGSTGSQGGLPGIPWNPDSEQAALDAVNNAGWSVVSAEQLAYDGKTDVRGTYYGEAKGYETAQAEVLAKYDAAGKLSAIGIAFRGTSGPRESLVSDTIGDLINDLLAGFGPDGYAESYTQHAFGRLLSDVAEFAQANGLNGADIVVSGHSLGGLAVNSMAALSDSQWGGFYSQANYLAFASPSQFTADNRVANIGYENDPVFRALNGSDLTAASLGVHDTAKPSATNNIVNFNDHYASDAWNMLPFSILNVPTWLSHLPFAYQDGLLRVLNSEFYPLTQQDSTVIVSNLSNVTRDNTWVQDVNRNAQPHSGPTFIIGSDGNDLIKGGRGNDFLEGRAGDDTFRDDGGFNLILAGEGKNTLDLQRSLQTQDIAYDGETLYLRDGSGENLTLAQGIGTLSTQESLPWWPLSKQTDYQVSDDGLHAENDLKAYAVTERGDAADNTLTAQFANGWLFGMAGNDKLVGSSGDDTLVGGTGDDELHGNGGNNTFLFSGSFGHDTLYDLQSNDRLVFIGSGASGDYRNSLSEVDDNLVLTLGDNSVTLVGITAQTLSGDQLVLA
ncbi:polyurethanase [Serratia odorifera]|uniref:polyurethane esterase n=1 Tax=Serratia odorifera TaxID=618 RepID=UPI0023619727|nr:polyurethanase [Serratia odorifera]